MLYGKIRVTFVYHSAMRKFDLKAPKIGDGQRKLRGVRALKNGGGSLAVGSYLQRGSGPPPSGLCPNWCHPGVASRIEYRGQNG